MFDTIWLRPDKHSELMCGIGIPWGQIIVAQSVTLIFVPRETNVHTHVDMAYEVFFNLRLASPFALKGFKLRSPIAQEEYSSHQGMGAVLHLVFSGYPLEAGPLERQKTKISGAKRTTKSQRKSVSIT